MSDPTLSRRAVACPGWRWLAGMRLTSGLRIDGPDHEGRPVRYETHRDFDGRPVGVDVYSARADGYLPDLTDPATIGALLALYDERRRTKTCPDPVYTAAAVYGLMSRETVEALVAALEAP